jgi:hypothetical protein
LLGGFLGSQSGCPDSFHLSFSFSLHPVYLKTSAPRIENELFILQEKKKSSSQKNRHGETKMWIL